jgi:hypothetical protein
MKTLNDEEAVQWVNNTGILASVDRDEQGETSGHKWTSISRQIAFQPDNRFRLRIGLREVLYYRMTNLAHGLLPVFRNVVAENKQLADRKFAKSEVSG